MGVCFSVLDWFLWGWFAASFLYIAVGGKKGFFWVKQRLPWMSNKGAFYVKGYQSGYVDIDYSMFSNRIEWGKDTSITTQVDNPYNKERSTGIPVIFAKEKEMSNFDPFSARKPVQGAEMFSQLLISSEQSGYNRAKKTLTKKQDYEKWILYGVAVSVLASFAVIFIVASQLGTLNDLAEAWNQYQPVVKQIVEAYQASGGSRLA